MSAEFSMVNNAQGQQQPTGGLRVDEHAGERGVEEDANEKGDVGGDGGRGDPGGADLNFISVLPQLLGPNGKVVVAVHANSDLPFTLGSPRHQAAQVLRAVEVEEVAQHGEEPRAEDRVLV